tara:strand:+ start:190580 stop:191587 length:1008 start_codon:yes stop_codon:yes gene_type:complete
MKILIYSAKNFEIPLMKKFNKKCHSLSFTPDALDMDTAHQAVSCDAISIFPGDDASLAVLEKLRDFGVKYISLRSVGYNNIHLKTAKRLGFKVANTPEYSPYAIAEHTMALLLALNRKIVLANDRVHRNNFLQDDLMGSDLHNKTVGIVGVGRIGSVMAKIYHGFGCRIVGNDLRANNSLSHDFGIRYTTLEELLEVSDVVSLHLPLTYETHYLIDSAQLGIMKKDAILINTARGALVNTEALIKALEKKEIAAYGTDVYEIEKGNFFKDHAPDDIKDGLLKKLLSMKNVLLTPHQAYVTKEALTNIAQTTLENMDSWAAGMASKNELGYDAAFL